MKTILAVGLFVLCAAAHAESVQVSPQRFVIGGDVSLQPSEVTAYDGRMHLRFTGMKSKDLPVLFTPGDDSRPTLVNAKLVELEEGPEYVLPRPVPSLILKHGDREAIVQQIVSAAIPSGGMTSVRVKVLHKGMQDVERMAVFPDGEGTMIGDRFTAIQSAGGVKIDPEDFTSSWQLAISKVTFDEGGTATVEASLDTREARQAPTTQIEAVRIKAGESAGVIHGANGKDYLLSVRHIHPEI